MRVLLRLQYLGTRYAGWQSQENAESIQTVVEGALSTLCRQPVRISGAGRTDAGVHAEDQRAHLDLQLPIPLRGLVLGVNDLLPPDVRLVDAVEVDPEFHARFAARWKTYRYQIWNHEIADPFRAPTHTQVRGALDEGRMEDAARRLVGSHDFRTFTVAEPEVDSTSRTVTSASVEREGAAIRIRVRADGFLRYMARRIAGHLIEIGRGKLPAESIAAALEPRFEPARWTAPAEGLVLERIEYGETD